MGLNNACMVTRLNIHTLFKLFHEFNICEFDGVISNSWVAIDDYSELGIMHDIMHELSNLNS